MAMKYFTNELLNMNFVMCICHDQYKSSLTPSMIRLASQVSRIYSQPLHAELCLDEQTCCTD